MLSALLVGEMTMMKNLILCTCSTQPVLCRPASFSSSLDVVVVRVPHATVWQRMSLVFPFTCADALRGVLERCAFCLLCDPPPAGSDANAVHVPIEDTRGTQMAVLVQRCP